MTILVPSSVLKGKETYSAYVSIYKMAMNADFSSLFIYKIFERYIRQLRWFLHCLGMTKPLTYLKHKLTLVDLDRSNYKLLNKTVRLNWYFGKFIGVLL